MGLPHRFFKQLFFGVDNKSVRKPRPAISRQVENLSKVWNCTLYKDFGIERILRLSLVLMQFVFLGMYIRHVSGKKGLLARKVAVEAYAILKVVAAALILCFSQPGQMWAIVLVCYLGLETIVYLLSVVYLSPEYTSPISYIRSLTMLFVNFLEITLDFGVLYKLAGVFNDAVSRFDCFYFSVVTATTLGFGDISPTSGITKMLVVLQSFLSLLFIVLLFGYFTSRIGSETYYNKESGRNKSKRSNYGNKSLPE